jgi:hypothetical protein
MLSGETLKRPRAEPYKEGIRKAFRRIARLARFTSTIGKGRKDRGQHPVSLHSVFRHRSQLGVPIYSVMPQILILPEVAAEADLSPSLPRIYLSHLESPTHVRLVMPAVHVDWRAGPHKHSVAFAISCVHSRATQYTKECVSNHLEHAGYSLEELRQMFSGIQRDFSSELDPSRWQKDVRCAVQNMVRAVSSRLRAELERMESVDLTIRQADLEGKLSHRDAEVIGAALQGVISILTPLWKDSIMEPDSRDTFLQVVKRWKNSWNIDPSLPLGKLRRLAEHRESDNASTMEDVVHLRNLTKELLARTSKRFNFLRSLRRLTDEKISLIDKQKITKELEPRLRTILDSATAIPEMSVRRAIESLPEYDGGTASVYRLSMSTGSFENTVKRGSSNTALTEASSVTEVTLQADLSEKIRHLLSITSGSEDMGPNQWMGMAESARKLLSEIHTGSQLEHTESSIKEEVLIILRQLTAVFQERTTVSDSGRSDQQSRIPIEKLCE